MLFFFSFECSLTSDHMRQVVTCECLHVTRLTVLAYITVPPLLSFTNLLSNLLIHTNIITTSAPKVHR